MSPRCQIGTRVSSAGRLLPPVPQVTPLIMEWIMLLMRSRDLRLQALTHQDTIHLDRSIVLAVLFSRLLFLFFSSQMAHRIGIYIF